MDKNIKKILYYLTRNSRITTKKLAGLAKTSQQSVSYRIKQLEKRSRLRYTLVADPVKMGLINIIVGYNFRKFDSASRKAALDFLTDDPSVIHVEISNQGIDVIVEYCLPNLSAFNKTHMNTISKNRQLATAFIYPVIVKHVYDRNYLMKGGNTDVIICADRKLASLNEKEIAVFSSINKKPDAASTELASIAKVSVKTFVKIKKDLQQRNIIRMYSCTFDHDSLGISRHLVLLDFSGEGLKDIDKMSQYCSSKSNIVEMIKLIGDYQVMLVIEEFKTSDFLREIRSEFQIANYILIPSRKVIKKAYIPENIGV